MVPVMWLHRNDDAESHDSSTWFRWVSGFGQRLYGRHGVAKSEVAKRASLKNQSLRAGPVPAPVQWTTAGAQKASAARGQARTAEAMRIPVDMTAIHGCQWWVRRFGETATGMRTRGTTTRAAERLRGLGSAHDAPPTRRGCRRAWRRRHRASRRPSLRRSAPAVLTAARPLPSDTGCRWQGA